jgi:hypothetical protein
MAKTKKTGPARMMELGKIKVEIWLTAAQHKRATKMAKQLGIPLATLARRVVNQVAEMKAAELPVLRSPVYD